MAPINLPDGTEVSEVILPDGTSASAVVAPDGSRVFSAIPDSEADQKLVHRYALDDVNGTVADSVADADATNNGVVSVSGDYAGGSAGDGDGAGDYIALPSDISTWFAGLNDGAALALTIDNLTTDGDVSYGQQDSGTEFHRIGTDLRGEATGKIGFDVRNRGDSGDLELTYAADDTTVTDGDPYRVVFNWPSGIDDGNVEIWINQSSETVTVLRSSNGIGDLFTPSNNPFLFAWNVEGSAEENQDTVIDDVCYFGESLTQSEIESYQNPWS
jgi:hypothetical protein